MLYSTHKHTPEKPRYRLVIPFNREVKPNEYEPICRKIAETIGIDLFDITTYQLPRLFYWPSTSKDGEFIFEVQDGKACNVDEILNTYHDYNDISEWPVSDREGDVIAHEVRKAGDPLEARTNRSVLQGVHHRGSNREVFARSIRKNRHRRALYLQIG